MILAEAKPMTSQNVGRSWNRVRFCCSLTLLLSASLSLGRAPADASLTELDMESRKHRDVLQRLLRGDMPANPNDKSHVAAADFAARYATYRFTFSRFHKVATGTDNRDTLDGLYYEFDRDIKGLVGGKEKTKDFARLYAQKVIEHGLEVLDHGQREDNPLVQVNIARVLARTAVLGHPSLAVAADKILTDPNTSEAVKYYMLRGLRDLLAQMPNPTQSLGDNLEAKIAKDLVEFITRKVEISPITPQDEKDGLRMVRREAVRALAQLHNPGRPGKGAPATVLLHIMNKKGFNPEPLVDERMEAAIGLARLRPGMDKDYQPAFAAQQIALFLNDFAEYYSTTKKEERRPCRIPAAQLLDALESLKNDTKDKYVLSLFDTNKPGAQVLERIVAEQTANPADAVDFASRNSPPIPKLFKNGPAEAAPAPPKKS